MKRFFSKLFGTRKTTRSPFTKQSFRPIVDALEERTVLNGDYTTPGVFGDDMAEIVDDVLYIRGTNEHDIITLEIDGDDDHQVRASVYQFQGWNLIEVDSDDFDIDDFDSIEMRGFDGEDFIVNMTDLDAFMSGGADNDMFYSMGGDDVMAGNGGNDEYAFHHELQSVYFNPLYNDDYEGEAVDYYFANLGNDTIIENAGEGTRDELDFYNLEGGVDVDMADPNTQNVSPGILSLTLQDQNGDTAELERVFGTGFADTILGNDLDNQIYGRNGNDVLNGRGGNDNLFGDSGDDTLEGEAGDDYLRGGTDDDTYVFRNTEVSDLGSDDIREYNNQGRDTLDFSDMVTGWMGIQVDLAETNEQDVNWYTYSNFELELDLGTSAIEDVKATDTYDTVKGNDLDNHIWTYEGGDNLEGRGGDDVLEGGTGADSYVFWNETDGADLGADTIVEQGSDADNLNFRNLDSGIVLDLQVANVYQNVSDKLELKLTSNTAIETVYGTDFDDAIYGNTLNNNLYGYSGVDVIFGRNGADYLSGGNDTDYIYGGNHDDTIDGGNHNDYLYGEGGLDTISGGDGADYLNGGYANVFQRDYADDVLYGYTRWNSNDGDQDTFVFRWRRFFNNFGYFFTIPAYEETAAGFESGVDIYSYVYLYY